MKSSSLPFILLFCFITIILPACAPSPGITGEQLWTLDQLRAIKQVQGVRPSQELIAVYTRIADFDLQIRLDFLDLNLENDVDIFLVLDVHSGGTTQIPINFPSKNTWDKLIFIPSIGTPHVFSAINKGDNQPGEVDGCLSWQPTTDLIARVARDPWNDTVVISLNKANLLGQNQVINLQVFLTSPELYPKQGNMCNPNVKREYTDMIGPVNSVDAPMIQSKILIAFWNTFAAYTPSQALRLWDGAHTGPFGGRHGLQNLLQAARHARVPIILLDLKNSTSLSALDYMGKLQIIQNMADNGLVALPDVASGSFESPQLTNLISKILTPYQELLGNSMLNEITLIENRQNGLDFGLSTSSLLYISTHPFANLTDYRVIFAPMEALKLSNYYEGQLLNWQGHIIIPIPPHNNDQVTPNGLSILIRLKLLSMGSTTNDELSNVLIMGGDFPNSNWGIPEIAQATFQYIQTHPWIQVLNGSDLLNLSPVSTIPIALDLADINRNPLYDLNNKSFKNISLQRNPLYTAARQMVLSLSSPITNESSELPTLRTNYYDQVAGLTAAADWATTPFSTVDCKHDPDQDNQSECILASENIYAMFENDGGRLVFLVSKSERGVHQWIAPSTQFLIGLSDPSGWNLLAGAASDPGSIPGGFIESVPPWPMYLPSIQEGQINFSSPDGQISKTFRLTSTGLDVTYSISGTVTIQIPLGLDPWSRFTPGWGNNYEANWTPGGWNWGQADGSFIEIQTNGKLTPFPFTASRAEMTNLEDPNYEYPRGHYLPFPMALVEIQGKDQISIHLMINDR